MSRSRLSYEAGRKDERDRILLWMRVNFALNKSAQNFADAIDDLDHWHDEIKAPEGATVRVEQRTSEARRSECERNSPSAADARPDKFAGDPGKWPCKCGRQMKECPCWNDGVEVGLAMPDGPRPAEARPPRHGGLCPEKFGRGPCAGCLPPDWGVPRQNEAKPTVGNCMNCGEVDALFFAGRNMARAVEALLKEAWPGAAWAAPLSTALEAYRTADPDPMRVIPDEQLEAWAQKARAEGPIEVLGRPDTSPELETPIAAELLRRGGPWLGAARQWLEWNTRNGDQVTWGSGDLIEPQLSVRQIEDLAAEVAAAAMRPQPSEERLANALKARWKAEAEAAELRRAAAKPGGGT